MKNILNDAESIINLEMFGIAIPALKSRKTKTIEVLLEDRELYQSKEEWLITDNPYSISRTDVERIHSAEYASSLFSEKVEDSLKEAYELINSDGTFNRYYPEKAEVPLKELFTQVLHTCGGTYYASRKALETGFCYFMGGGMHHGHKDFGHGFCPTNDIMIAAARILSEKRAEKIWIIDVDAHKGDGTAEIARDFSSVKTLSIHMADGWPLDKPEYDSAGNFNPAYFPSHIDIPIKRGEEDFYIPRLKAGLEKLENLHGEKEKPDLAIVLLGVDPYEKDELPSTDSLKLTEEQMLERDKLIFHFFNSRRIASAYTMAGGYGRFSWKVHYNFLHWLLKNE
ncbi:MAG: histone deacetylase [Spirochaetaceae bacterium]|nr:histone deacetylase [Spirochaetaceae bacterium]